MNYIKANYEDLEIGKIFYFKINMVNNTDKYFPVKIIDLTSEKVKYEYEDGWKEYINKSQYNEIYLYKIDRQLTLF